jgi:hypothetical protein
MFRKPDGDTHSLNNSEPFWAVAAFPSAEGLLASLVSEYVTRSRDGSTGDMRLSGMAHMLTLAAMVTHGMDEETATEWVGDMINDIETGRD